MYLSGLDDRQVVDVGEASTHGCPQAGGPKRHPGAEPPPQLLLAPPLAPPLVQKPLLQEQLHLPPGLWVLETGTHSTVVLTDSTTTAVHMQYCSTCDRQYYHSSTHAVL